ncbi:hypothetical protein ACH4CC_20550 [Streptomyces lydicus]|uniref:hypothetical protein n=1 Tax=Streptomyces lydicus TaxID=47763 RepID=UPI0037A0AB18
MSSRPARRRELPGASGADGERTEALDLVARSAVTPLYEVFAKEGIARAVAKAAAGQVRFRAVVSY